MVYYTLYISKKKKSIKLILLKRNYNITNTVQLIQHPYKKKFQRFYLRPISKKYYMP